MPHSDTTNKSDKSASVRLDPSPIMALATGYWASVPLFAAVKLGIFNVLAEGAQSAQRVAQCIGADVRGLTLLLDACCALGLLERSCASGADASTALYSNSRISDSFLVDGRPGCLGTSILWSANQYSAWGDLVKTVQTGKPAVEPSRHLGEDRDKTRQFVTAMHHRALGVARGVINFLPVKPDGKLLDAGGGPGTYSALLTEKYPALHATVLDLPGIVAVAHELLVLSGADKRVAVKAGDILSDELGSAEFDNVLFSGVLHQMGAASVADVLARAFRALLPGGRIIISDIMIDDSRTNPSFATLFSLQMLLTSDQGSCFSAADMKAWLLRAGFEAVEEKALPQPLPYKVLSALKPT